MFLEPKKVEFFETVDGTCPYEQWLDSVSDGKVEFRIMARVLDLATDSYLKTSDCRDLGGGVLKLNLDLSEAFRIYFGKPEVGLILVLGGGSIETELVDIASARRHLAEFFAKERRLFALHATQN